jgi:hypothetical protein
MASSHDISLSHEVQVQEDVVIWPGETDEHPRVFEYQNTRNPICFQFSTVLLKCGDLTRRLSRKIKVHNTPSWYFFT